MASVYDRLRALGIELPSLPPPAGNYLHAVSAGNLLFLAGKGVCTHIGKVGGEVSTEQGYAVARATGLVLLSVIHHELGSLDRVTRIVKVLGLVNAVPDFTDHPQVINGCSDLFVEVFGERGRHARTAIGAGSTPDQIPLEIEAVIEFSTSQ